MTTTTTQRRYAFVKVSDGDYLLPTNDRSHVLRFSRYEEDGSAQWQDAKGKWHEVHGLFWQVSYARMPREGFAFEEQLEDWLGWSNWTNYLSGSRSRKEALEQVPELVSGQWFAEGGGADD